MTTSTTDKKSPPTRSDFRYFDTIDTRWSDNDVYGHVNNVAYYSFFDTVVNRLLIDNGWLHLDGRGPIGLVVETRCQYYASVSYPAVLDIGLTVLKLGNSSVVYQLAVFSEGSEQASAVGQFVHVYVDRPSHMPTPLPTDLRAGLNHYLVGADEPE
ncbi:MAG: acyl-CoA thioesterase [Alteromonadaceae bacterium]|jgi:acyl-CoA thioester hydrolase|uniref:Acyl-CoA thioester hydrolase n=1 Tax=Paraglaciecola mesophila KMM 241 TaxID=1128912 RepID=K6Z253_9ALTE|nr:thioesterase family protein [Paraglaciecola mesophila]MAD15379.1 acyl-CoA thioesterase [Alteromonadaceae bacterium]MBB18566.1 acyl-CoA thioesterase [Rickettsiales bacterium]GAC24472.1 acyl-CoA thioester hydrolase [Paraglaciecola mesophila KMM 241]